MHGLKKIKEMNEKGEYFKAYDHRGAPYIAKRSPVTFWEKVKIALNLLTSLEWLGVPVLMAIGMGLVVWLALTGKI